MGAGLVAPHLFLRTGFNSMMTRKHFQAIADSLSSCRQTGQAGRILDVAAYDCGWQAALEAVTEELIRALALRSGNPLFDADRFRLAAGTSRAPS